MKKKRQKVITIVLVVLLLLLSIGMTVGCVEKDKKLETEYFKYNIYQSGEGDRIAIIGLTSKGEQLKNIVIPEEIDGKMVTSYRGHAIAPNVKKIIVSYNMLSINSSLGLSDGNLFVSGYPAGLKVLYINCQFRKATLMSSHFYIATAAVENFRKGVSNESVYAVANMQYLYNYENAPNQGVYFIDDLAINEELEIIPSNPQRDGYTFTGWYTEPKCQNRIELRRYVKNDEEIVYLYAGWENN